MAVQPFTIDVPQAVLDDVRERLGRTRWSDEVTNAGWDFGVDLAYLKELAAYWRDHFDWRSQETSLNRFDHCRVTVDGFGIHFIHQRGEGPNPMPLVLTHGWPSSFYEMHKIIPLLTEPGRHGGDPGDAFSVVVPSLPGYGFSDRPTEAGFSRRTPELWARLMNESLGYPRFAAHGVDIGAFVTNRLGLEHAERVIGIHVTLPAEPYLGPGAPALGAAEQAYLAERQRAHELQQAYAHLQRTTPQTPAYGLTDSPVGLAAWIVEKWRAWSDCGGDVERRFTKDELLTTVMIYWATATIGSSMRVYYDWKLASAAVPFARELYFDAPAGADAPPPVDERIPTPAGVALFEADAPREWVARAYGDLRRFTVMPRGGHFAAMEEPELLVEDIRATFRPLR